MTTNLLTNADYLARFEKCGALGEVCEFYDRHGKLFYETIAFDHAGATTYMTAKSSVEDDVCRIADEGLASGMYEQIEWFHHESDTDVREFYAVVAMSFRVVTTV